MHLYRSLSFVMIALHALACPRYQPDLLSFCSTLVLTFKAMLEEAEKMAQQQQAMTEQLTKTIVEPARPQAKGKHMHLKRVGADSPSCL